MFIVMFIFMFIYLLQMFCISKGIYKTNKNKKQNFKLVYQDMFGDRLILYWFYFIGPRGRFSFFVWKGE